MTAIKDFDLRDERDKLQFQLTLLDDTLRKKAAFETEDKKLLETKSNIQQLFTKLATLEEYFAIQQAEIERLGKDHEVKTQQWKVKSEKSDSIMFMIYASLKTSEPEPNDLDQLKIAAELAKETSNLFAQMLHIRELKKGVSSSRPAIDEAKLSLSTKEKLREDLEHLCQSLRAAFEEAEAEFHQNIEAELLKQIKSMASRISQSESRNSIFGTNTRCKEQLISSQYSRIHELESDLRTKNQLVDTLQAKVAFLSFDDHQIAPIVNASDKTAREKVNLAFMKGRDLGFRMLGPLALAGRYIRARKLEWQKKDKDKALVERGNLSSHYGMALADATLFQHFCPCSRTDFNTYTDLYVLHPDFIWKNRDCNKLLDILDWHCAMKDFHGHSYTGVFFDKTSFYQLSKKLLSSFHNHQDDWDVEKLNKYFSKPEPGHETYEILKKQHDTAFREHQNYLEHKSA